MALFGQSASILALWLIGIQPLRCEALSYLAAVYEHQAILNPHPKVPLDRKAALEHMKKNLDVYEEQATIAAKQGVQIIVFPEDGIHGFNYTRRSIAGYLETVPDPEVVTWSPCADPDRFPNTEVQHWLSCIAHKNRLFLVANMPDCQPCNKFKDTHCPSDGHYHFNTNVVFSDNGTLVARYHKQNLYFEAAFDTPPKVELVTFITPFAGRFGVFTCFDILFREPVVTLVRDLGVRQLVYPTAWMNQLPLLAAVQFQHSFSYSEGVTLLAANVRSAALGMTGSGIFAPQEALYHHEKGEAESGKLLVSRVPVLDMSMMDTSSKLAPFSGHKVEKGIDWFHNISKSPDLAYCQKEECHEEFLPENSVPFTSMMMYDNFTMVQLQSNEGNITVCDGSLCCHLLFRSLEGFQGEFYALGAFDGLHTVNGVYYLEVCALVKCAELDKESCGGEVEDARTKVDFRLEGTFTTQHIYASMLQSRMNLELPDESGWERDGRFYMQKKGMTSGLVTAVLYGRVYEKDGGIV